MTVCVSEGGVDRRPAPETEETNYIEPEPSREREGRPLPQAPSPNDNVERNEVVSTEQMCKDSSLSTYFMTRYQYEHGPTAK